MEDTQIIQLFFQRSEQGIHALDKKYGRIFRSLSYNILHSDPDAEECVNDAYLGTWNSIPPARPNPLLAFVCKIVRNLSLKRHAYNTAAKRNSAYDVALSELEDCLAAPGSIEAELESKELTQMIQQFLDSLSAENRVIFMRRYWFSDPYSAIAKQVGLSEKNVSVRLSRMRSQLRVFLSERGVLV